MKYCNRRNQRYGTGPRGNSSNKHKIVDCKLFLFFCLVVVSLDVIVYQ